MNKYYRGKDELKKSSEWWMKKESSKFSQITVFSFHIIISSLLEGLEFHATVFILFFLLISQIFYDFFLFFNLLTILDVPLWSNNLIIHKLSYFHWVFEYVMSCFVSHLHLVVASPDLQGQINSNNCSFFMFLTFHGFYGVFKE